MMELRREGIGGVVCGTSGGQQTVTERRSGHSAAGSGNLTVTSKAPLTLNRKIAALWSMSSSTRNM